MGETNFPPNTRKIIGCERRPPFGWQFVLDGLSRRGLERGVVKKEPPAWSAMDRLWDGKTNNPWIYCCGTSIEEDERAHPAKNAGQAAARPYEIMCSPQKWL